MKTKEEIKIAREDLDACWDYVYDYFVDVLNGDYDLEDARDDLRGLIGSKYDKRIIRNQNGSKA